VIIRVNQKASDCTYFTTNINDWKFHPTDASADVAVFCIDITSEMDHLAIPTYLCLKDNVLQPNTFGIGDEVFIIGLFHHHYGMARNIPIVRIGNLIALNEEKVRTRLGFIDAYLIEARSIGGISGSPVFINFGHTRAMPTTLTESPTKPIMLLGLIHGHFDTSSPEIDQNSESSMDILSPEKVNTGIAIVVPAHKIQETIAALVDQGEF
jgi:hypothetical protein